MERGKFKEQGRCKEGEFDQVPWAQLSISVSGERRKNMSAVARPRELYLIMGPPFMAAWR